MDVKWEVVKNYLSKLFESQNNGAPNFIRYYIKSSIISLTWGAIDFIKMLVIGESKTIKEISLPSMYRL